MHPLQPADPAYDVAAKRFAQLHERSATKYAAFCLPIRNDIAYLAVRATPPFEGLFSLVGGKVEREDHTSLCREPLSQSSIAVVNEGFERPSEAALRELCTELYSEKQYPHDFTGERIHLARVCRIDDCQTGISCLVRAVHVPAWPFRPNPRELGAVKPVHELRAGQINPLTQLALHVIAHDTRFLGLGTQLPPGRTMDVTYAGQGKRYLLIY